MSIELDWQIVEDEPQEPETPPQPPVQRRRRWPRISRKALAAVALILVVAIAGFAVYYDRVYHAQLDQVKPPVLQVAHFEAQAVSKGDRDSYLAVQDPDDSSWREMQAKRFGKLEKQGLPEWGWKATDVQPVQGGVTLEPGGARLDVTYRFSVTQPMPNGATSVTVVLPQYYKQTPSGWVRALPVVEYWGAWRQRNGKYFAARFVQRDADLLEPLAPRMDALLAQVCDRLPCPPQPIYVVFENSSDALASLDDFTYGFDDGSFKLKFPAPQLFGVPADAPSREEFYRAIGTRMVEALVYEASGRRLNMAYQAPREIVRWELARAGLSGPFFNSVLTATLRTAGWLPLAAIPLRTPWTNLNAGLPERNVMLPLAFVFLEEQIGPGSVTRLIPTIGASSSLGEAINKSLNVNAASLEAAWRKFLQRQSGYSVAELGLPPPGGELALWCARNALRNSYSVWRVHTDGSRLTQVSSGDEPVWPPHWSPDGELNCPSRVTLAFETWPGVSGGWWSSAYGGGETTFTLKILSPHLSGLPTDDRSREELYRAIEIQVVRELVTANWPGQRPRFNSVAYQQLLRWHLAQAGLTGPFITPEITSTLATAMHDGAWQPLSAISLDQYSTKSETVSDAMVPLAFDFIAGRLGMDSLVKLTPAIGSSPTRASRPDAARQDGFARRRTRFRVYDQPVGDFFFHVATIQLNMGSGG